MEIEDAINTALLTLKEGFEGIKLYIFFLQDKLHQQILKQVL